MRPIKLPSSGTQCWLLSDGRGPSIVDVVFDDVDPDELIAAIGSKPQAPDGPYNCLFIRTPDALVLVDTWLGSAQHPLGGAGGLLWRELDRVGVAPGDVDLVVISHGHLDHIGLVRDGEPAFPHARYLISDGEWDFWDVGIGARWAFGACCDASPRAAPSAQGSRCPRDVLGRN